MAWNSVYVLDAARKIPDRHLASAAQLSVFENVRISAIFSAIEIAMLK